MDQTRVNKINEELDGLFETHGEAMVAVCRANMQRGIIKGIKYGAAACGIGALLTLTSKLAIDYVSRKRENSKTKGES